MQTAEKKYERAFKKKIERLGGLCLKFHSASHTGMPDRLVLMPWNRTYWVEFKGGAGKLTLLQQAAFRDLNNLGHRAFVVNSEESLEKVVRLIKGELEDDI